MRVLLVSPIVFIGFSIFVYSSSFAQTNVSTKKLSLLEYLQPVFQVAAQSALPLAPAPAVSGGFKRLDFNEEFTLSSAVSPNGQGQHTWYPYTFYGNKVPSSFYKVSNGILTVYDGNFNGTVATAAPDPTGRTPYLGRTWRHGYFEARIRVNPSQAPAISIKNLFPAFWSDVIEHATGKDNVNGKWQWAELDFMEAVFNVTGSQGYSTTIHQWTGLGPNLTEDKYNSENNFFRFPAGTDFNQFHKFGCLWTPGRITYYFDDKPGPTVSWVPGGTFSILDEQNIYLILGSGANWPMEVDWVRVWK